jgi:hypothetical protein
MLTYPRIGVIGLRSSCAATAIIRHALSPPALASRLNEPPHWAASRQEHGRSRRSCLVFEVEWPRCSPSSLGGHGPSNRDCFPRSDPKSPTINRAISITVNKMSYNRQESLPATSEKCQSFPTRGIFRCTSVKQAGSLSVRVSWEPSRSSLSRLRNRKLRGGSVNVSLRACCLHDRL